MSRTSQSELSRPFSRRNAVCLAFALAALLMLDGCKGDVVHTRSMAELNQKAQAMMQAGDYNGAVARLESAHDLDPNEVNTTHNLAIAYQMQGNYDKAIETLGQLMDKPGMDKAEIQKGLGICYEAKADKLASDAKTLEDTPKADKTQIQQLNTDATQNYQQALGFYQQAVGGLKNPNQSADIQKQIDALQSKLNHPTDNLHP